MSSISSHQIRSLHSLPRAAITAVCGLEKGNAVDITRRLRESTPFSFSVSTVREHLKATYYEKPCFLIGSKKGPEVFSPFHSDFGRSAFSALQLSAAISVPLEYMFGFYTPKKTSFVQTKLYRLVAQEARTITSYIDHGFPTSTIYSLLDWELIQRTTIGLELTESGQRVLDFLEADTTSFPTYRKESLEQLFKIGVPCI